MSRGSPEAAAQLQQAGAEVERERVSALTAEFSDDPTFLQAAIADPKVTVQAAMAAKYKQLKPALATAEADLKKAKEEGIVGFAAGDKRVPAAAIGNDNPEALEAEALAAWNADATLRAEFVGVGYATFLAGFKAEPHLYRKAK